MTLIYELDLDILPLDLHAKIQVCMFLRSSGIVRRTHTQTDTHTMPKLLHPPLTLGVINRDGNFLREIGIFNLKKQTEISPMHFNGEFFLDFFLLTNISKLALDRHINESPSYT